MSTQEQIQSEANIYEFLKVLADEHGATLVNSQTNANMLTSFLTANAEALTVENLLAAVLGPLRKAMQWVTPPTDEANDLPPVPPYMEFLKSKADIALITGDGRFVKWMKSKHKNQLSDRINFILKAAR